jgi:hypothetical protein
MEQWSLLLDSFETHTEDSKARIQAAMLDSRDERIRSLAEWLLGEWDLAAARDVLSEPAKVFRPDLAPEDAPSGQRFTTYVAMVAVISRIGVPENVEVLKNSSGDMDVEAVAVASFERSLFRPAFRDGRFVEREYLMLFRFDVH